MMHFVYDIPNRDGLKLKTFVFLPDGDPHIENGAFPTVIYRNPYTAYDNPFDYYRQFSEPLAEGGYAVVVQNCRGRGGSEGEFIPFAYEREDGLDLIKWVENAGFFNGEIYLAGGSYLCFVHLSYMNTLPESVKGAYLHVMSADGTSAFFKAGAFKTDIIPVWYLGLYHTERLIHKTPHASYKTEWAKLPKTDYTRRCYGFDVQPFNDIFLLRNDPDACKGAFSDAADSFRNLRIPVLVADGWSEMFLDGMIQMWEELPNETRDNSAFLLGPWGHHLNIENNWCYTFDNNRSVFCTPREWFDHIRNGEPLKKIQTGMINYYIPGQSKWSVSEHFQNGCSSVEFYLHSNGLLSGTRPKPGQMSFNADPDNPVWFPGGPNTFCTSPVGFAKQPDPGFSSDVLTFISEPLSDNLSIHGKAKLILDISSDCMSTMFIARMCCIEQNGNATVIQDAPFVIDKIEPNTPVTVTLNFGFLCWTIRKSEKLRIDISSSDSHSYMVHPNVPGDIFSQTKKAIAHQTVFTGNSRLIIPTDPPVNNASSDRL